MTEQQLLQLKQRVTREISDLDGRVRAKKAIVTKIDSVIMLRREIEALVGKKNELTAKERQLQREMEGNGE